MMDASSYNSGSGRRLLVSEGTGRSMACIERKRGRNRKGRGEKEKRAEKCFGAFGQTGTAGVVRTTVSSSSKHILSRIDPRGRSSRLNIFPEEPSFPATIRSDRSDRSDQSDRSDPSDLRGRTFPATIQISNEVVGDGGVGVERETANVPSKSRMTGGHVYARRWTKASDANVRPCRAIE
uniref:Uncharacterized protein n=1 Tax=Corethron hystrix TaxID=216773 RepID=A0A7S1BNL2_9STRA|mmetsp:Transcript_35455/g.82259  ORF Transcript_35455/g.82259 Transcript_35455/m.82259 type:complete len:180 (+) Transcript_35455:64-603(+)